jgi:type I restriction enzyme, R subunit
LNSVELKQLEDDLWKSADTLRANSDLKSTEYSTPVLGLIFLKFADNKYRQHEKSILSEYSKLKGTRREKSLPDIAIEKCGFYLPGNARYDYLLKLPEEKDIAKAIKDAMKAIEEFKPELQGVLPQDESIDQGMAFCREKGINLAEVLDRKSVFKNIGLFNDFADILLGNDEWRKASNVYENTISSLYEAGKPEILGQEAVRLVAIFQYLRGVMDSIIDQKDIDAVSQRISELLDESVVVDKPNEFLGSEHFSGYQMVQKGKTWDLSKIDFEKLKEDFNNAIHKNIQIADLRAFIDHKLEAMLQQNGTRTDFAQRLQQIIDTYNAGGSSNENYFEELLKFTEELKAEDERHIKEGLTEDELELFDLLKKDTMTQEETQKVKLAARKLLHRLIEEKPKVLVQDWYKDSQTQRVVRSAIEQVLHKTLPASYDRALFKQKCDRVFDVMLDYAGHGQKWAA